MAAHGEWIDGEKGIGEYLGVHARTVQRYETRGWLKLERSAGVKGRARIKAADLDTFLANRKLETFVNQTLEWKKLYHAEVAQAVTLLDAPLPHRLVVDNSDGLRTLGDVRIEYSEAAFTLPDRVRRLTRRSALAYRSLCKETGRRCEDNPAARCTGYRVDQDAVHLTCQRVQWLDYVASNMVLDATRLLTKGKRSDSLRDDCLSQWPGRLPPIAQSPLADPLGIEILLFTPGGQLVLQKRSRFVGLAAGRLCASVSGTVEPDDLKTSRHLGDMDKVREARLELGVDDSRRRAVADTLRIREATIRLLGITRDILMGGEYDVFFAAETTGGRRQIRTAQRTAVEEWETDRLLFVNFGRFGKPFDRLTGAGDRRRLTQRVRRLLEERGSAMSLTLRVAIALWLKRMVG